MGYFLPETEPGAAQRWEAEPVGVGAESAFHHSHAGMYLLPNRKTLWDHARITCSVFLNAMDTCEDFQG